MTSAKVVNIKNGRRLARSKAPRTMEEIAEKASLEYERLKCISDTEPANLASGDPSAMHEEHGDDFE